MTLQIIIYDFAQISHNQAHTNSILR